MQSFKLAIDEKLFNLLWRSLCARENELLAKISDEPDGSDDAALLGTDLAYLHLCKKGLEERAGNTTFSDGVFSLDENFIDLSDPRST